MVSFDQLPDDARLWTFHAERTLSDAETARLRDALNDFITTWAAHRKDLTAGYELRYNQFILIGVDESRMPPSGCSIDSLVAALKQIGSAMGVELVDAPDITYRSGNAVHVTDRNGFANLVEQGSIDGDTVVFDRMATRVADVRQSRWERPARDSWHARAFEMVRG